MKFDFSETTLKRVRCTNPKCSHVFKVYDRREPVINDPGFVVKMCPKCKHETRFHVWNVDYFKGLSGVVGVYETEEAAQYPILSVVKEGEYLEEHIGNSEKENVELDLNPKLSFWELFRKKEPRFAICQKSISQLENDLYWAKQAHLCGKLCVAGVDSLIVRVLKRKNAQKDYDLFAKQLSTEHTYNLNGLIMIGQGGVDLRRHIDGLYKRDECFSILDFCLKRWAIIADEVLIAVPFIGFQYKNKRCKNQVLYYWAFLNSVLDMGKTVLLTRKGEFNRVKDYLNEQRGTNTFEYKKNWGKLDKLQEAAVEASKRRKKKKSNEEDEDENMRVFFTNRFHSKFYAGILNNKVEVLIGSYNVHEGEVLENLSFKEYALEDFKTRYLDRIMPEEKLLRERPYGGRTICFSVNNETVSHCVKNVEDII